MVSERYLGSAAEIEALLDAREAAALPERTRHLAFGDVAAAWGLLDELGVTGIADAAAGRGRPAAAVHRDVPGAGGAEPAGRPVLQGRFRALVKTTAVYRFTKVPHRRWITASSVTRCTLSPAAAGGDLREDRGADRAAVLDLVSSVALYMTNFATFIATANSKAPVAQRCKAKQKRADLRLSSLFLVFTLYGGIPLTWHAYPRNKPYSPSSHT